MQGHAGYKEIHHNKVAETSQHNKDVEHLMGTEILMLRIKNWKFQRIDHAADGINNSACQKPSETCPRQIVEDRHKSQNTQPAHSNVNYRGKPFRAVDPAALEDHADDGDGPYQGTEDITGTAVEDDQAYRCIAACDHHEDHHVIHFFQAAVHLGSGVYGMVKGACQIKQDHSQDKNTYCKNVKNIRTSGSFHEQRSGTGHCKEHGDPMSNSTSRVF